MLKKFQPRQNLNVKVENRVKIAYLMRTSTLECIMEWIRLLTIFWKMRMVP